MTTTKKPECKCSMSTRMLGDGCSVCNPELAAEYKAMTTTEHLQRIKAKCEQLLAIAEKRTAGEWGVYADNKNQAEFPGIESTDRSVVLWGDHNDDGGVRTGEDDAAFIASCAGPAEAGWRATIVAIEWLETPGIWTDGVLRKAIITAWPEEIL